MFPVYYRALVNFTDSLVYGPELEDIFSAAFNEISEAVVDTVRRFWRADLGAGRSPGLFTSV